MKTPKFRGRKKPYSSVGISRVPCARCGKPSTGQWDVCANNNHYLGACASCDLALNRMVLKFFKFTNIEGLLAYYKRI